jgi:SAM-dependent methyltransferase
MHAGARDYIAAQLQGRTFGSAVEIGGRDINGGIRDLVSAVDYTAIDLYPGIGVDIVADATQWKPDEPVDLVVCCEVLEHAPDPRAIVEAALSWLKPRGLLLLTCATDPRAPHSTHDGGPVRDGEHYGNIDPEDLMRWLREAGAWGLEGMPTVSDYNAGDLYASAWAR